MPVKSSNWKKWKDGKLGCFLVTSVLSLFDWRRSSTIYDLFAPRDAGEVNNVNWSKLKRDGFFPLCWV
jgi:hypothetical protein